MSADHNACDDLFVLAEKAAHANKWQEAENAFNAFRASMAHHFRMEENQLFPALIAAGGPSGPVQMMLMEHGQMNSLLDNMAIAARQNDALGYTGLSETLLIVMQQHNLKGRADTLSYPRRNFWQTTGLHCTAACRQNEQILRFTVKHTADENHPANRCTRLPPPEPFEKIMRALQNPPRRCATASPHTPRALSAV